MMTKTSPKKKQTREFKAWAIMEGGKLACFDYSLPVYWMRYLAKRDAADKLFSTDVRRVRIIVEELTDPEQRRR